MKKRDYKRFNRGRLMPSKEQNDGMTEERFFDRSDASLLLEAKAAWDGVSEYRRTRMRNRDYTFGKQWGDRVTTADGRSITEEQYLKEQGKVPLKNNMIRQLVKNVVGQFRSTQTDPVCISRDRDEQRLGEMMSIAIQYAYQLNRLRELDGRTMEEFLISGSCFHKVGYGWRNNKMDVWVDVVNPNRVFFNPMEDCRHWDCTLIGELHDVPVAEVVSKFAKGSRKRAAQLRRIYEGATQEALYRSYETLTSERLDNLDFLLSSEPHLCRVIEVWRLESRERLRCHDTLTGSYFKVETDEKEWVDAENRNRLTEAQALGVDASEVALIEYEWFVDRFWFYRFFSPFGDLLESGETPYWHGEHPYSFRLYPLIDGEIHSFVEDVIDQQRYINRLITMIDFIMGSSAKGVLLFPEDQIPEGMSIEEVAEQWTRYNGVILFRPKAGGMMPQQIAVNATNVGAYELLNLQMRLLEDISGVHGAMQGKSPLPGTSGALFAQQIQHSSLNLVDIFESFKMFREERDTKVMKTVQQFYQDQRYHNIAGAAYSKEACIYTPERVRNVEFDLSIGESVTSPVYRAAANDFLLELFRMGQISIEMLLENGAFPFSDRLLQSVRQAKEKLERPGALPDEGALSEIRQTVAALGDPKAARLLDRAAGADRADVLPVVG